MAICPFPCERRHCGIVYVLLLVTSNGVGSPNSFLSSWSIIPGVWGCEGSYPPGGMGGVTAVVRARNLTPGIGPKGPAEQGRLLVSSSPQPTVPAIAPASRYFLLLFSGPGLPFSSCRGRSSSSRGAVSWRVGLGCRQCLQGLNPGSLHNFDSKESAEGL